MNKEWESEDYDGNESDGDFDEHELESRPPTKRALLRRRIELLKEKRWLQQQLDAYDESK